MSIRFPALIAALTLAWLWPLQLAAQPSTPPPKAPSSIIDAFAYEDDGAAQQAWTPMRETAGVSVVHLDGRTALRMPCNFEEPNLQRASWDRRAALDLSTSRGVQFDIYCADPSPISYFSIYFRSGAGWYQSTFSVPRVGEWNTIQIDKADTRLEDTPAGWGSIDIIRISAWRGKEVNTEFYIANLGILDADAPCLILRGEYAAKQNPNEAKGIETYAQTIGEMLKTLGLPYGVMSDLDVTPARLQDKKLVILPYNPQIPEATANALMDFTNNGGKILSCYLLPRALAPAMGLQPGSHVKQEYPGQFASIRPSDQGLTGMPAVVGQLSWNIGDVRPVEGRSRVVATWYNDKGESTGHPALLASDTGIHMTHVMLPDDAANKRLMLLAMIGHFLPEYWQASAEHHIDQLGRFGPFTAPGEAERFIEGSAAGSDAAQRDLDKARTLRTRAASLVDAGNYPEAIGLVDEIQSTLIRAYCEVQKPLPGEHRAWWCHCAFGVDGMTWDEAIRNLAHNGFTDILPNMLWGGTAYYQSTVLPVAPEVAEKGDQIALCVAACKKYGVGCHVWKVNWNAGSKAPKAWLARMKQEGRTQVDLAGKAEDRWLCPSHPLNQQLEIDAMVEVAQKYEVDGIHFDYIRFPHSNACFCQGCRERFEQAVGVKVASWPDDVRNDEALNAKWLEFRRAQITRVVAAVSERARKVNPDVEISAAVFRNWPQDRDNIGQDWKVWCDKGYLDFVCPMDYTPHNTQFRSMVQQQLEWTGSVPCYPGIGLSCWPDPMDICRLIDQIAISRELKTGGFTIFNYGAPQATDVVPMCGLGITRVQ